jgi:hypothetical protein
MVVKLTARSVISKRAEGGADTVVGEPPAGLSCGVMSTGSARFSVMGSILP